MWNKNFGRKCAILGTAASLLFVAACGKAKFAKPTSSALSSISPQASSAILGSYTGIMLGSANGTGANFQQPFTLTISSNNGIAHGVFDSQGIGGVFHQENDLQIGVLPLDNSGNQVVDLFFPISSIVFAAATPSPTQLTLAASLNAMGMLDPINTILHVLDCSQAATTGSCNMEDGDIALISMQKR